MSINTKFDNKNHMRLLKQKTPPTHSYSTSDVFKCDLMVLANDSLAYCVPFVFYGLICFLFQWQGNVQCSCKFYFIRLHGPEVINTDLGSK